MIQVFHGMDESTHEAFQAWRRANPDGFNLSQGRAGEFTAHWAMDRRDHGAGRGCMHQGGSDNRYADDGVTCLTRAKKVCSSSLSELLAWAETHAFRVRLCKHCDAGASPLGDVIQAEQAARRR
jgi:hypothetical protein